MKKSKSAREHIKYSKDLEWLKPFVEHISSFVPLSRITAIKSYKVKKGLVERRYGSTVREMKNNKCVITLKLYTWSQEKNVYVPDLTSIILDTLAHELAHVKQSKKDFGDHDYKHFEDQAYILFCFGAILKSLKITDTSCRFNNLSKITNEDII